MPHLIIGHTFAEVCGVVAVEVVTIDQSNDMICCGKAVDTQFSAFLHDYGGECVLLLLVS